MRVEVADALSVDFEALLGPAADDLDEWSSVSNLPYNVAVPVVMRLLEEAPRIGRILVMVQREVGERLAAAPGDDQYGAVSVKVAYFAESKVVGVVPPTVFVPRPNVESVLVRMRRRAEPPVSVPSPDAAVHAGAHWLRPTAQDAPAVVAAAARRPHRDCAGRRGGRAHRAGRGARAGGVGGGQPLCGVGRVRLARVRATAYPKLTLSLRVLGLRPDGFHDLEALVVSLGQPQDVLEAFAVPAPGGVQIELDRNDTADDIPADHRNLAFIAAEKLLVRAGRSGHGVRLVLRKRIPAGAGLGGGSADAAAALLAVRRLLEVDVDDAGLMELAAEVGSDVSFCVRGGSAWMRGRGEQIEPLDLAPRSRVRGGDPAVPALDPGGVQGLGPSWVARKAERSVPGTSPICRRAGRVRQRSRAGGGSGRAPLAGVPQRARVRRRAARRCWRGAARPTWCPLPTCVGSRAWSTRSVASMRVPVVGTTSVSRGVRLA